MSYSTFKPLLYATWASIALPAFAEESLPSVSVTGSRFIQSPHQALAQTSVITRPMIDRSGADSLVDLLSQEAGVDMVTYGNPFSTNSVMLRGNNHAQTLVLVDGIRINNNSVGGASLNALPLDMIQRIDIIRGPLSSLYGADAVGGVINIITQKEGPLGAHPSIEIGYGTNDTYKTALGIQASDERSQIRLNVSQQASQGFNATRKNAMVYDPDKDGYQQLAINGGWTLNTSERHQMQMSFGHSSTRADYDNGMGFNDQGTQTLNYIHVNNILHISPTWESQIKLGYNEDIYQDDSYFGQSEVASQQHFLSWQHDWTIDSTQKLSLSYEYLDESVKNHDYAPHTPDARQTHSAQAAWLYQDQAHEVQANVRFDDNSHYGDHLTGSVAYAYRYDETLSMRASVGTGYRAPSFNELFFPGYGVDTLKAERSNNVEIGALYQTTTQRLDASLFKQSIRDLIIYQSPCPLPGYPFGCASNVGKATIEGMSLDYSHALPNKLRLGIKYDWLRPRNADTHMTLPRRPQQRMAFRLEKRWQTWLIGSELSIVGHRYDDVSNTLRMGTYTTTNIYGNYDLNKRTQIRFRLNNLFDKDYELAHGYNTAGRTAFVSLIYKP